MDIFFDKKRISIKVMFFLFAIYLIVNSGLYLILGNPLVNLLSNVALFFFLTFSYISSIFKKLLATVAVYVISMATEIIIYIILISFITDKNDINIIGNIISSILFYFIIILLSNLKNIKTTTNKISWNYIFILTTIFICSIYISIALAYDKLKNNIYISIGVAAVLIVNILTVYIYDVLNKNYRKELEQKLLEKQNNFYVKQLEIMRQSQNNMKILKHDIKNHMIAINSISDNNIKVKEYINDFIKSNKISEEYSKSGNVIIDSILNYKLQEAIDKEIEINLKIKIPPQLNILPFDLSIILGNILDNAIEAASKSINEKQIRLNIYVKGSSLYIHITNTFDGIVIAEDKKYKTTKTDKLNHGLGLLSVINTLEKYDGGMDISYTECLFSIKILIDNII